MLWPLVEHILELDLAQFTLMMLAVLEMRTFSLTVPEALLSPVHMPTQRMLECDVKVWRNGAMILLFNLKVPVRYRTNAASDGHGWGYGHDLVSLP